MIAAVVVTYNRKELLQRNINMLLKQTIAIDKIYVIDNCSTDGTYDDLARTGWLDGELFRYIRTDENIGGAGGFYTGMKLAYDEGADWILLMDDDGYAADEETFSFLINKAYELYERNCGNQRLFVNSLVQDGDLLSFQLGDLNTVEEAENAAEDSIILGQANPFNGTLISRELVDEIGFPNQDFFIKGDEVDYKHRALKAGAHVCTVVTSRYNHPRPNLREKMVLGIKVPFVVEAPWKEYYTARNFTFMGRNERHFKAIAFEVVFVKLLAILSTKCNKKETIKMVFKGVIDGWNGKLGTTVKP